MKNPALLQEPRYEPAIVIPLKQEASLLDWLKASGRLIPREPVERDSLSSEDDLEALIENEDDFEDSEDV